MDLNTFIQLQREDIAKIVNEKERPRCVALMLDGTRRMLKLEPGHHDDNWLYDRDHVRKLIYKSIDSADILFDMGVSVVIGPLVSLGNLHRAGFVPTGIQRLLEPLLEDHSVSILKKQGVAVSFYGDLQYINSLKGGRIIDEYAASLSATRPETVKRRIAIGLGFSTDKDTELIAHRAIKYYQRNGREPTHKELVIDYFGFEAPPIDIFIRTNEIRASGGLTPLLTDQNTQLYFPVSPGILSFSEPLLKRIFHDYLFNRSLSGGTHEHRPLEKSEIEEIKQFYCESKDLVLGIGRRVGDVWIHKPEGIK